MTDDTIVPARSDASRDDGKIVTFYSFKGGVGRTTALGITAARLAQDGHRVLCIDLDLEAPGLADAFDLYDAVDTDGNAEDPHGELKGQNVLHAVTTRSRVPDRNATTTVMRAVRTR